MSELSNYSDYMNDNSDIKKVQGNQIDASQSGYDKTKQNLNMINETLQQTPIIQGKIWPKKDGDEKERNIKGLDLAMIQVPENEGQLKSYVEDQESRKPEEFFEKRVGQRIVQDFTQVSEYDYRLTNHEEDLVNRDEIKKKFDRFDVKEYNLKTDFMVVKKQKLFQIIVLARTRRSGNGVFKSYYLHITNIEDPKNCSKTIYLTTVAITNIHNNIIPDYFKIPNGLLYFKRDQKTEMKTGGYVSFQLSESTLKLFYLKLPNMEEIEMSEFNIHENLNRFDLYFLRQIFTGERFVGLLLRQEDQKVQYTLHRSDYEMKAWASKEKAAGTKILLVDGELMCPIKFEEEDQDPELVQLAKDKGLITCSHHLGQRYMCDQDCVKAYISSLFIVRTNQEEMHREFYKPAIGHAKNQIISFKSVDKPIFEASASYFGACFNKKFMLDGQNKLQAKIEFEIHLNEERKRYSYDLERGQDQILKDETKMANKSTETFRRGCIEPIQQTVDGQLFHFFFDKGLRKTKGTNEIELLFCNKDQDTNEIKNKIKQYLGKRDGVQQELVDWCFLDKSNQIINCPSYRSKDEFKRVIGGGWYPANAIESKDEIVMTTTGQYDSKIKVFRMVFQNEQHRQIFSMDTMAKDQMFGSLKMQLYVNNVHEYNSVYSQVGITGGTVIRIDEETNKRENLEVKSKDDNQNVLLVQDRLGKYLRLTHQEEFYYCAHKNDGDMHLFVFEKANRRYFVYKTWKEIEKLERSRGALIDDELQESNNIFTLQQDDNTKAFKFNNELPKEDFKLCDFQQRMNKAEGKQLVFTFDQQYICLVGINSKQMVSQWMPYKCRDISQSSETRREGNKYFTSYTTVENNGNKILEYEIEYDQGSDIYTIRLISIAHTSFELGYTEIFPQFGQNNNEISRVIIRPDRYKDVYFVLKNESNYQYKTKLLNFGTKKIYDQDAKSFDEYKYIITFSSLSPELRYSNLLTEKEKMTILEMNLEIQMNQIPFDVFRYIRYDYPVLLGLDQIFTPLEVLYGGCYFDCYLLNKLKFQEILETEMNQESFFLFKPISGLIKNIPCFDYQFWSPLTKAIQVSQPSSVGLLIQKIQQYENTKMQRDVIEAEIPQICGLSEIPIQMASVLGGGHVKEEQKYAFRLEEPIFGVAEVSNETDEQIEVQNIPLSVKDQEYAKKKLAERHELKLQGQNELESSKLVYEVQHVCHNFWLTAIRYKVLNIKAENGKLVKIEAYQRITQLFLSNLMMKIHTQRQILMTQYCMNIIETQYKKASNFFKYQFGFFMIGYIFPILSYLLSGGTENYGPFLLGSPAIVQVLNALSEIAQILQAGGIINYFKEDSWNIADQVQIFSFFIFYFNEISQGYTLVNNNFWQVFNLQIIVFLAFLKVLFFLRLYPKFASLVQMLIQTVKELASFLLFMLITIIYFAFSTNIFGASYDSSDYVGIQSFVVILIQTFRNSIGDISAPIYDSWSKKSPSFEKNYMIGSIWMQWLLNLVVNLIILLNFLIAVISQTYDQVIADQQYCQYSYMCEYNSEYFRVKAFFKKLIGWEEPDLVQMILTQPLDKTFDIGEDINLGIVNNVKRIMSNMLTNLQRKNCEDIKGVKAEIKADNSRVQAEITRIQTEITKVQAEITIVEQKINEGNSKVQAEITRVKQEIKQEIKTEIKSLEQKMDQLIQMMLEKQSS